MNRVALTVTIAAGLAAPSVFAGPPGSGSNDLRRPAPGGAPETFPFSDNFDSYPDGVFPCASPVPGCTGPNGWALWYVGGPQLGQIVSGGPAHSGTKALKLSTETDITQTGAQTAGQWVVTAQTYAASNMTGTAYFIVLTRYNSLPAPGGDTWSIEIDFHGDGGFANNVRNAWQGANQMTPLIRDQWVEIRAEIDLDANTFDLYYGNTLLVDDQMYAFGGVPPALACLDLYAGTLGGDFFYDTVVVEPVASGCYANCDDSTTPPILNVQDFTCFLQRYAAGESYANCDNSTTPPVLNVQDFTCFLQSYAAGCP